MNECAIINLNQISPEKLETRVLSFNRFHAEGLHGRRSQRVHEDQGRESLNCGHILTNEFTEFTPSHRQSSSLPNSILPPQYFFWSRDFYDICEKVYFLTYKPNLASNISPIGVILPQDGRKKLFILLIFKNFSNFSNFSNFKSTIGETDIWQKNLTIVMDR